MLSLSLFQKAFNKKMLVIDFRFSFPISLSPLRYSYIKEKVKILQIDRKY